VVASTKQARDADEATPEPTTDDGATLGNEDDGSAGDSESTADTDANDDEKAPDEDDSEQESVAAARPERRWRRRLAKGAAAVILTAAVAVSAALGWVLWQQRAVTRAGQQAQQAAVEYAQILTSIDSNKVDENFNQVLDGATGEFKDMYTQSSIQLRQLLIDNKAAAHGVVLESAIQSASKNKVVVLLFVDQSVANASLPDPRIDRSRIKMTMEFVDGHWRTSKVELP
jgi:Mce-associated membrane protein